MANKKLLYNENGTNAEIANSGSLPAVYFDDVTNTLVAQGLVINKVTASIGLTNGILGTDANGKLTVIPTGSNGQYLQSDGTSWAFRDASGVATGNYLPGSDLSGTLAAPTVTSIQYVVSGTLSASNGGTGVSSFTSGGLLVKDNTSALKFVRPDAGASVLRPDGSGSWYSGGSTGTASYNVSGAYYTSPGTWTKPVGHRNIKVILMGGGGGGAVGFSDGTPMGFGGNAGGFSIYDFIEKNDITATITVGSGGVGGIGGYHPALYVSPGNPGGNTIFSSSSYNFISYGGSGGTSTPSTNSGFGNISLGRAGICSGAGGKGGGDSLATPGAAANATLLLSNITASGGTAGAQTTPQPAIRQSGSPGLALTSSIGIPGFYAMFGSGGGGGDGAGAPTTAVGGAGGDGIYGSGGGGGGCNGNPGSNPVSILKQGGRGGDGYAIIISW
jgi:hypothetical protein